LRIRITVARRNVIPFARMTGSEPIRTPYTNHRKTPVEKMRYIPKEMSRVDFVFAALMTCGRKDIVVNTPAIIPIDSV
jgi:hypothetical protein